MRKLMRFLLGIPPPIIGEYLSDWTLMKIIQKRSWIDEHLEIVE